MREMYLNLYQAYRILRGALPPKNILEILKYLVSGKLDSRGPIMTQSEVNKNQDIIETRVVHPTGFALGWVGIRWHPTDVLHWVGIRVDTQYPS